MKTLNDRAFWRKYNMYGLIEHRYIASEQLTRRLKERWEAAEDDRYVQNWLPVSYMPQSDKITKSKFGHMKWVTW